MYRWVEPVDEAAKTSYASASPPSNVANATYAPQVKYIAPKPRHKTEISTRRDW